MIIRYLDPLGKFLRTLAQALIPKQDSARITVSLPHSDVLKRKLSVRAVLNRSKTFLADQCLKQEAKNVLQLLLLSVKVGIFKSSSKQQMFNKGRGWALVSSLLSWQGNEHMPCKVYCSELII